MEGMKLNLTQTVEGMEFKNHDEIVRANEEVYKRRFLNAMTQGAAKCNHMFHMVEDELSKLDLGDFPTSILKWWVSSGHMFYVVPKMDKEVKVE